VDSRGFKTIFSADYSSCYAVQCSRAITRNFVDGKFTLGENIGDLGGINAAYDGLQLYLKKMENLIDGTHQSNVSLCLGLQSGDLKHVMKRLKTR
jgi:predicted metalloendopeptidase